MSLSIISKKKIFISIFVFLILIIFFTLFKFNVESAHANNKNDDNSAYVYRHSNNDDEDIIDFIDAISTNDSDKAIVVRDDTNHKIYFYYDCEDLPEGKVFKFESLLWRLDNPEIKVPYSYYIDETFKQYNPINCICALTYSDRIENLNYLNTSQTTNMRGMFKNSYMDSFDLTNFDTSNTKTMQNMFKNCKNLVDLNVQSFQTSNVESMEGLFAFCTNLSYINVSNFDTCNVKSLASMFSTMHNLNTVDLSNFKTFSCKNFERMFFDCSSLENIDLSNFDTSNAIYLNQMFTQCKNLKMIDLSNFDTSKNTDCFYMFYHCDNIKVIDISNFDFSLVYDVMYMFGYCEKLTTIYTKNDLDIHEGYVLDSDNMFIECFNLIGGNGTKYNPEMIWCQYAKVDGLNGEPGYFTDKNHISLIVTLIHDIDDQIYNGTCQSPDVQVLYLGNVLVKDKDYQVSYSNNKDVGIADVVITGIGRFYDQISTSFNINKAIIVAKYVDEEINLNDIPNLKIDVNGFVNNEDETTAKDYKAPVVEYPENLSVGQHELLPCKGEAKNYEFSYLPGTLTVKDKSSNNISDSIDPTVQTFDLNYKYIALIMITLFISALVLCRKIISKAKSKV